MSARGLAGSAVDKDQEKGRVGQAAVKRYWPGRAPDWYNEKEQQQESDGEEASGEDEADVTAIAPPVVIKASDDPRLKRLAQVCPAARKPPHGELNNTITDPTVLREICTSLSGHVCTKQGLHLYSATCISTDGGLPGAVQTVHYDVAAASEHQRVSRVSLAAGCRGRMMIAMSRRQQRPASFRGTVQRQKKRMKALKMRKRRTMSSEKQGGLLCARGAAVRPPA